VRNETAGLKGRAGGSRRASRRARLGLPRRGPAAPVLTLATVDGSQIRHTPPRRRVLTGVFWPAVVLVAALLVGVAVVLNVRTAARPATLVVASLPYWNIDHGTAAVLANRKTFSEASPWMYGLDAGGRVVPQYGPAQSTAIASNLKKLRAAGVPIVPTIANITGGNWSYQPAALVLHDPAVMARHVAAIVALVQRQHYAGIDIDYEDLHAADRQAFAAFVTDLAAALHAKGKILSVALFAKTTNAGTDPRNVAQDYAAIGRAADQVRLMAYDYHWGSSPPGPVAPIGWVRDVLNYAKSQIPAQKIILGVPLYGYDWIGSHGVAVSWLQAFRLATTYKATTRFDTSSQTPWFSYTDGAGRKHVVWFENAESSKAKFAAVQGSGIGGMYVWMYGYEDTGTWLALRHTLPGGQPSGNASGAA
jgi:spore germination protein YaaH